MSDPAKTIDQNILPVQALFNLDNSFNTFIGQGQPFIPSINPVQSGLTITNSTLDSSPIGATTPSTGNFTNISTVTGTISTAPVGNTDIVNKNYADMLAFGLSFKNPAIVATTANITLSGLQTIDGYTTLAGDRVLVKNQTNQANNGIYIASATAWARSSDANTWDKLVSAFLFVDYGTVNAGTAWYCTAQPGGTLGVTAISFSPFSVSSSYSAGTGLQLTGSVFSIANTTVSAGSYGSGSSVPTYTVNAQGQLTAASNTSISISGSQITSGTIGSSYLTGSYTGITGVGTLTSGTWNANTIGVGYGGTGATTFTAGYLKASGTTPFTTSATIPTTDLSGTISNAQLANSTISGVSLGNNLFSLTIGTGLSGTSYNGSSAVTINNTAPMIYPTSGIPNSTGSSWGTSYSTSGSGTVVPLATGATLNNPTISNYLSFTSSTAPSYSQGAVWYDSTKNSLAYYNDVTNNTIHIGEEIQLKVYNNTGSTINIGQPVYVTSTTSGFTYPNVALAIASSLSTGNVIGLANQAIPTGNAGYVTTIGLVQGVNTGSYTVGDTLYLSPYSAGYYQNTIPPTGYAIKLGTVAYVDSSNGAIYVNKSILTVQAGNIVGQVPLANGGTNANLTAISGGVVYSGASALGITAAGTTGQFLTSNGSSPPTWTTSSASVGVSDNTSSSSTFYPLFAATTSGSISTINTSSTNLQYVPSTGKLTALALVGSSITDSGLTSGRVTYAGTGGLLQDSANFTFNGTTVTTANDASISGLTVGKGGGAVSTNTAVGYQALNATATGAANTGIGYQALLSVTSAYDNTAVGTNSLSSLVSGNGNVALGKQTLQNTTGNYNTGIGLYSLRFNTSGANNSALGGYSLYSNTTASQNSAFGYGSLATNTTGNNNSAIGYNALNLNVTGQFNTAVGASALQNSGITVTAGSFVVGVAYTIISIGTTDFTLIGAASNTVGLTFTATGAGTGTGTAASNTNSNTAVGYQVGSAITTGNYNVAVGSINAASQNTLGANTTGALNTAIGSGALAANTTSNGSTAVGYGTLQANTGANNSAIGYVAGQAITSGTQNTLLGTNAGNSGTNNLTTGSNNIIIGYNAAASSATVSNEVTIGNDNIVNTRLKGNVGIGVTPSAWSAYKVIDINTASSVAATTTQLDVGLNYYWNGTNNIYKTSTASTFYRQNSGAQHQWWTAASGTAGNIITFVQNMTLDASGNLGIGIASPNANTKLDVNGPIRAKGYTVATLPTGTVGAKAYVTDALSPTFLGTLTGGGAVTTPVFYNGTAWVAG
jgi:hypothetical protein